MRPRIYNILLLLAGMLLAVAATTSCVYNTPGGDEELTLLIKLSPTTPFRAIEQGAANDSYTVDTYKPITLFFYDEAGAPTEPYRVELKNQADIDKAMSADGYEIKVRQAVRKVSAVAGRSEVWKATDLDGVKIYELQKLGGADATESFLHSVPYVAPQAEVQDVAGSPNKLTVELQPVPNVARLEISGNIEVPLESQESTVKWIIENRMKSYSDNQTDYSWLPTPEDLMLRTISDVTIRGIYVNNYKETPGDTKPRIFLTDENWTTDKWTSHNAAMHTLFGALNETNDYAKKMTAGKVDAYQIYPGVTTADKAEALDHIIVAVDYKVRTQVGHFNYKVYNATEKKDVYACTGVEDRGEQTLTRFITIRKFLVGEGANEKSLVSFDPGKIYRINLKDLSPLFSTNTNPGINNTNEITEVTPRPERTDERPEETSAAVRVDVSGWTHININTELE